MHKQKLVVTKIVYYHPHNLDIPVGAEYYEYTKIASFPKNLVIPAKKGKRNLQFKVYFTNLDMIFENGVPKEDKRTKFI